MYYITTYRNKLYPTLYEARLYCDNRCMLRLVQEEPLDDLRIEITYEEFDQLVKNPEVFKFICSI